MKRNSHGRCQHVLTLLMLATCCSTYLIVDAPAQEPESPETSTAVDYGVWKSTDDASGKHVHQMRLRVHAKAAPMPAFRHRLVPAADDRVDGNAALFYLKAMGFFEQNNAREQLTKLQRKWRDEAIEEQRDSGDYAPNTWYEASPESLPMDQVRQYLELHAFQPEFLYDAARRTRFEHDRAIEREENPIGYLLPSIQQHRELARVQNVRCRFAIAEGRIDDAVEIVGQMMAMGRHLGRDEFLVTCLVGASIHGIGVDAGLVLSQQTDTPNLYWAIAACPDPVLDLSLAFSTERNLLFRQLPILKQVTEKVRPPSFWAEFTREFTGVRNDFASMVGSWSIDSQPWEHMQTATAIAKDYPVARQFLSQVIGMSDERLDQYHKAQVVFLAIVRYHEFAQDEAMKQFVAPPSANRLENAESELMKNWGLRFNALNLNKSLLALGDILIPATEQVLAAAARTEQHQNLWQTVEALRLTAAENGGKFPVSLEELSVPAPLDPATNRPFEYELNGDVATVRGTRINSHFHKYQIDLELATQNPQETSE